MHAVSLGNEAKNFETIHVKHTLPYFNETIHFSTNKSIN